MEGWGILTELTELLRRAVTEWGKVSHRGLQRGNLDRIKMIRVIRRAGKSLEHDDQIIGMEEVIH
jgi:non-homologous end joining protein Ku